MENNNLKKYVDNFFYDIELYDDYKNGHGYKRLLKSSIDMFLDYGSAFNAIKVYEVFFDIYQITSEDKSAGLHDEVNIEPNIILDIIKLFFKYENESSIPYSIPVHSVNVFIMGLAIYSQNINYRKAFEEYVLSSPYEKYYKNGDDKLPNEEFLYRWGIASLLCELALPLEWLSKSFRKKLTDEINFIFEKYDEFTYINLVDLEESNFIPKINFYFTDNYCSDYDDSIFLDLFKPTEVLVHKISNYFEFKDKEMRLLTNNLNNFVNYMEENNFIDHGFISSILILNIYGYLIQKYGKNSGLFFYSIADSATSIFLHNYYRNILKRDPFNLEELDVSSNPIAFLLILCEEIQNINRSNMRKSYISNIEIDDERIDIECVSNNFKNFTTLEGYIYKVLDIDALCRKGLSIVSTWDGKEYDSLRDILKSEIRPPNITLRSVEKLAIQMHQAYIGSATSRYLEEKSKGEVNELAERQYEGSTPFEEISSPLVMANIRQAEAIHEKLNFIGYEIAYLYDEREAITNFSDDETLDMAIYGHELWCREKISQGWSYGEVRDDENLIHNCIVPWEELSPEIQQYDIDSVKAIPSLVESCGFKIVKNKISLLCHGIWDYFKNEHSNLIGDLPSNNWHMDYIQTINLINNLSLEGYVINFIHNPGEEVMQFNNVTIDNLAQRQHEKWYDIKFSLGWKYGEEYDNEQKTSPDIVSWYKLTGDRRYIYERTFRNLPIICRNVRLKIVEIKFGFIEDLFDML